MAKNPKIKTGMGVEVFTDFLQMGVFWLEGLEHRPEDGLHPGRFFGEGLKKIF